MKLKLHLFLTIVVAFIFANTLSATTYTAILTGKWSAPLTWDGNGIPDNSGTADVIINDGVAVTNDVNFIVHNVTIGLGGAGGTLQTSKTLDTVNTMLVNGDISILANSIFRAQTNTLTNGNLINTLELKGNLTHNGSILDFRSGTAGSTLGVIDLTLSGTTDQTLTVNGAYSAANGDFNAITINKPSGKVILGSNIIMDAGSSGTLVPPQPILTLTKGIIETGNFIWVFLNSTGANITGNSSASYINGTMGQAMSNTAGASKNFPVGDANAYRLFNLRSTTSGLASGHYAIVKCIHGDANTGTSTLVGGIDRVSHVRYYQIGFGKTVGTVTAMSFDRFSPSYGADDGVVPGNQNLRVAYSTDSRATWTMIPQTITHTTVIAASDPQTMIFPDAITPISLPASGLGNLYVALADVTGGENPLPVELSSFASAVNGRDITLNWETKTEVNSDKFVIERTINDNLKWEAVASVKAAVLSNSPKQYSFTDKNLQAGKYQYRLKMIDNDGSFDYSVIVETEVAVPHNFDLSQNYPNPFNPSTKINYDLPSDSKVTLEVYNISGERIAQLVNENQSVGFYSVNFMNKNISSGVYFYRINAIDKTTENNFSEIKKNDSY